MVDISTNLRMLLQTYRQTNTASKKTDTEVAKSEATKSNTTANVNTNQTTQSVNNTSSTNKVDSESVVNKVNTSFNTNSNIFSTNLKNLYNNLLMVNKINCDDNGRVQDYETEFLNTYKSEITSTLYNKIMKNIDMTDADLKTFEEGISKLSVSDQKLWKDEIKAIREKIETSVQKTNATFTGLKDGILYQNGSVFSGIYSDGKYYQNGTLASGTMNGKLYQNGSLASGEIDGVLYQQGVAYTGTINGKNYENGVLVVEEEKTPVEEVKQEETVSQEEEVQEEQVQEEVNAWDELGINGEITGKVKQGSTGDCWVLSTLITLNSTEEGKQIIKDAIGVDEDGNATVTFKGLNKTYTVTKEEIAKYDTDNISSDAFSNGDNDALVLEIAAAKLRVDLATGEVTTSKKLYNYNNGETEDLSKAAYAGYSSAMMYFLTGKNADWTYTTGIDSETEVYATLERALQQSKKGDTAITVSLGSGENSALCADGSTFNVNIKTGHSFAVTNIDDDTITIVNPWDSSKEYQMSWEEFAQLNIKQFTFLGL